MFGQICKHLLKTRSLRLIEPPVFISQFKFHCSTPTMSSEEPPAKKVKPNVEVKPNAEVKPNVEKPTDETDFLDNIAACRLLKGAASIKEFKFNKKRARVVSDCEEFPDECKGIVYWMSRDQRVQDNWAMLYAQKLAIKLKVPLHVCFCLMPKFLEATQRHFHFMLTGLKEVEQECRSLDISFHLLIGAAKDTLPAFVEREDIGGIVTDFCPLRVPRQWLDEMKDNVKVPVCQVDAHNIVPCWEASPKQEYSARTIRNKINNQLDVYMTEFPPVIKHPHKAKVKPEPADWIAADKSLDIDRKVKEVEWAKPGTVAGLRNLEKFIKKRLKAYNSLRNDPTREAVSDMSPWYHFGQVGVQRAMIMVKKQRSKFSESVNAYLEEGIIRRELSDNFCYYNENYDKLEGAYDWAKTTLDLHRKDKRDRNYTQEQLDKAKTYDELWNGAQKQLVKEGKMHGFLRMYWAKKILEWTSSPEEALRIAIYLNDRYSLDGRDPNGYVGCMWSICGIHDQGWAERPVFGKIRYMNYDGCKRKFKVADFESKYKKTQL